MKSVFKTVAAVAVFGGAFALTGCDAGVNKTNVELIQDMMDQISNKSQDYDHLRNEPAFRLPPENTVPRGAKVEKYATDPIGAERNLKNPYAGKVDEKVMARGKEMYTVYCGVCHGSQGHAADDSKLKAYIPAIKPLVSPTVANMGDGRIYHIITHGQGLMGSYAGQVKSEADRWAIISYIRTLK